MKSSKLCSDELGGWEMRFNCKMRVMSLLITAANCVLLLRIFFLSRIWGLAHICVLCFRTNFGNHVNGKWAMHECLCENEEKKNKNLAWKSILLQISNKWWTKIVYDDRLRFAVNSLMMSRFLSYQRQMVALDNESNFILRISSTTLMLSLKPLIQMNKSFLWSS